MFILISKIVSERNVLLTAIVPTYAFVYIVVWVYIYLLYMFHNVIYDWASSYYFYTESDSALCVTIILSVCSLASSFKRPTCPASTCRRKTLHQHRCDVTCEARMIKHVHTTCGDCLRAKESSIAPIFLL